MCKRKGFTLVELLVVISIIAVLLSVLLPALSSARIQAKKVVCASYEKQWGLAFKLYGEDNKQYYPLGWNSPPYVQHGVLLMLKKYFGSNDLKIISCPVVNVPLPPQVLDSSSDNTHRWYTEYCYWGGITKEALTPQWWLYAPQAMKDIGLVKITDKPREVVLSDKCFPASYAPPIAPTWRIAATNWNHKAGMKFLGNNNLYGDGHVKHVKFNDLKEIQVDSTYKMMR
jgi:prepilin-type N-terminal cleavage/methylation domain-containing protein